MLQKKTTISFHPAAETMNKTQLLPMVKRFAVEEWLPHKENTLLQEVEIDAPWGWPRWPHRC